jgi:hypothetical protein
LTTSVIIAPYSEIEAMAEIGRTISQSTGVTASSMGMLPRQSAWLMAE